MLYASRSLTEVSLSVYLAAKNRQDYAHIAFGNNSTIFLHEINEIFNLSVYIGLFFSHFAHKIGQASWMIYCCT